ncbi:dicarboxylate/amino acid:cation symporter, partial [Streptomyces albidoflavus]
GSWIDFLTGIIPTDVITPFTELNVLQIVFMAGRSRARTAGIRGSRGRGTATDTATRLRSRRSVVWPSAPW